jgi:hypothetical protein
MEMKHHGTTVFIDKKPEDLIGRGFQKMFPTAQPLDRLQQQQLVELAETMSGDDGDNEEIPAGFTFFGQFLDHDITLTRGSVLGSPSTIADLENERTPQLELDSVYGQGPSMRATGVPYNGFRLVVGSADSSIENGKKIDDLPRDDSGKARIGDDRNDENLIIAQLHVAFLKFHNVVFDMLRKELPGNYSDADVFQETRRVVTWHYQFMIVNEYLPIVCGREIVEELLNAEALPFYPNGGNTPYIPIEFAAAAFRFGHSQVRNGYQVGKTPSEGASLVDLMRADNGRPSFAADWSKFFHCAPGDNKAENSMDINEVISGGLFELPFFPSDDPKDPQSLPLRNLMRGNDFGLPSGETVAKIMGVKRDWEDEALAESRKITGEKGTPLWFYILKEAGAGGGKQLGQVGGQIVAETFIGLLKFDSRSYLWVDPEWKPFLGRGRTFGIADILHIAESGL